METTWRLKHRRVDLSGHAGREEKEIEAFGPQRATEVMSCAARLQRSV